MGSSSRHQGGALSYHLRLFLLLLGFSIVLTGCFVGFQYSREKEFKARQLDASLQLYNMRLIDAIDEGVDVARFTASRPAPFDDLRVTVVGADGSVVFDNSNDRLPAGDHSTRPEIARAMRDGAGFSIRRHSESTGDDYFYSAMHLDGVTVRSAVPYSVSLQEMLRADHTFLWFMALVVLLTAVAGYFATRRVGRTITRLNAFARKAERGERIYDDESFPHDELGEISHHIIRLYARLQSTTARLDREHREALHQESEKIRIKKQLTNNINHELKTPVASMQVCLETLIEHPDMDPARRADFIARCYSQSVRLRKLLDDVALVTRMDEGSGMIVKEPVDLHEVIDEAVADLPPSRFTVGVDVPRGLTLTANRSMLASVFRNLIDNAVAYSGGTRVDIRLVSSTARDVTLTVADDGAGVDSAHLPHLFERFYRVDKGRSRRAGGTGLGLAIVKNAVMLHGGTVSVSNRASGGLEFVITLARDGAPVTSRQAD